MCIPGPSLTETGTAMERRRPSPIVESTSGGGRDISFVKGGLENLLQENLLIPDVCGRF